MRPVRYLAPLLVALAVGLLAAPARAQMTWDYASLVARDYWQARDVALPCQPSLRVLTAAEDADVQDSYAFSVYMLADVDACQVIVTPLAEWHRQRTAYSWEYCAAIVHEIGHLAGLTHDNGGVMDHAHPTTPFGCAHPRQWATLNGWRKPPNWVRRSPAKVRRLWLAGRVWQAQVARARWLRSRGN